jgi:hypothetical protein
VHPLPHHPGKGFRPDGKSAATLIPPAFGLHLSAQEKSDLVEYLKSL